MPPRSLLVFGDNLGLRHWWLKNRLATTERKLRSKRYALKRLRGKLEEAEGDTAALDAKRSKITADIDVLATKERALKDELRASKS